VWRNSKGGTGILVILRDASGQCVQGFVVSSSGSRCCYPGCGILL